jgi:hypothetical protein
MKRIVTALGRRPAPFWPATRGTPISGSGWRLPISGSARRRWTTDRTEFLGRHGRVDNPAALQATRDLAGRVGVGFDPCAAIQRRVVLAPDEETRGARPPRRGR